MDNYEQLLFAYENDLSKLRERERMIPTEDVVSEKDAEFEIQSHFEEEKVLEGQLGK